MPASSFTVGSTSQITAVAPALSVGTVGVTVGNVYGSSKANSVDKFTAEKSPQITSAEFADYLAGLTELVGTQEGRNVVVTRENRRETP